MMQLEAVASEGLSPSMNGNKPDAGKWTCDGCTFLNGPSEVRCAMCSTKRPRQSAKNDNLNEDNLLPRPKPKRKPSTPKRPKSPKPKAEQAPLPVAIKTEQHENNSSGTKAAVEIAASSSLLHGGNNQNSETPSAAGSAKADSVSLTPASSTNQVYDTKLEQDSNMSSQLGDDMIVTPEKRKAGEAGFETPDSAKKRKPTKLRHLSSSRKAKLLEESAKSMMETATSPSRKSKSADQHMFLPKSKWRRGAHEAGIRKIGTKLLGDDKKPLPYRLGPSAKLSALHSQDHFSPEDAELFRNMMYVETYENGDGQVLHVYAEDVDQLPTCKRELFARCYIEESLAEDNNGHAYYCFSILHQGVANLPNIMRYIATYHGNLKVTKEVFGKNLAKSLSIEEYVHEVDETFDAGVHQAGPMRNISLAGTVGEETGAYYEDVVALMERSPEIKLALPWGGLSTYHQYHPTTSDDGPILWCRPGEQYAALNELGSIDHEQAQRKRKAMNDLRIRPRQGITREKLIEDRTGSHADHWGLWPQRKPIAAVAFLQGVENEPEHRVVKDIIAFASKDYEKVATLIGLDFNEEPVDQRIDKDIWVDDAKLNRLRRQNVTFVRQRLRADDLYIIPRRVVHQFQTVSACTSVAWHLKYADHFNYLLHEAQEAAAVSAKAEESTAKLDAEEAAKLDTEEVAKLESEEPAKLDTEGVAKVDQGVAPLVKKEENEDTAEKQKAVEVTSAGDIPAGPMSARKLEFPPSSSTSDVPAAAPGSTAVAVEKTLPVQSEGPVRSASPTERPAAVPQPQAIAIQRSMPEQPSSNRSSIGRDSSRNIHHSPGGSNTQSSRHHGDRDRVYSWRDRQQHRHSPHHGVRRDFRDTESNGRPRGDYHDRYYRGPGGNGDAYRRGNDYNRRPPPPPPPHDRRPYERRDQSDVRDHRAGLDKDRRPHAKKPLHDMRAQLMRLSSSSPSNSQR
eukprot:Clim_evm14s146 gene=Clim_evmTU14s146